MLPVQQSQRVTLGRLVGSYGYSAGTGGGTVNVPAEATVLQISGYASGADGTITIGGGDTITVRDGGAWNEVPPQGALQAGAGLAVVFGASMDYCVSWVVPLD